MKILIINSARKFIGEAAHSLDLAQQLALQGHDAALLLRDGGKMLDRARERNLPVIATLKFGGSEAGWKSTLSDFRRLRRIMVTHRPDVLHCHRGNDHGLGVAVSLSLPPAIRPAIVRTRHRVMPVRNTLANRWLFKSATHGVIAVSQKSAASFGEMTPLIADKLQIVYSSVDISGFNPARRSAKWRREHGVAEDEPLIGLIARLQRVKGQEPYIHAAARVLQQFPRARFLLAGIGAAHKRGRLEALATELGIRDRMIFEDWLDDVHTATASLDIGVLASLGSEGSSRITYEYMASGVAVVATRVGCLPELIDDGQNGFLIPPGDVEAMADAIIRMLQSPEVGRQMKERALVRVEQFHNRQRWVNETLQVYEAALARRRGYK